MQFVGGNEGAKVAIECLKQKRSDIAFSRLYEEAKSFALLVGVEETVPCRVAGVFRSTVPSQTPEEYWRRSMYYPLLDHLLQEIQARLLSPELEKYYLVEHILPSNVSNLHDTSKIKEIF